MGVTANVFKPQVDHQGGLTASFFFAWLRCIKCLQKSSVFSAI